MNQELPGVQDAFRKGKGTRDQIVNICWIIEKTKEFQKNIYLCFINYTKAVDCVDHDKLWKALREKGIPDTRQSYLSPEKPVCRFLLQVAPEQQLEPCMEQLIGSRLRKEYSKAVCCHPVCLTCMLSTS